METEVPVDVPWIRSKAGVKLCPCCSFVRGCLPCFCSQILQLLLSEGAGEKDSKMETEVAVDVPWRMCGVGWGGLVHVI